MNICIDRNKLAAQLGNRIEHSTSPFHAVSFVTEELTDNGFIELKMSDKWKIKQGGKYYINVYGSSLAAFTVGSNWQGGKLRMAAAHTDFPCMKIKPASQIKANGCVKCNIEVYGGPILNTWLDRPLSAAGRIVLRSDDIMEPEIRLIDMAKPMFIIPNLAIHMNREVNKGVELNRQKDMLPIMYAYGSDKDVTDGQFLMEELARTAGVSVDDILEYDLFIYPVESQDLIGVDDSLFSAGRLDNMTSVQACIKGIQSAYREDGLNMVIVYDSEEVGSGTKQGAGSMVTRTILERIYAGLGVDNETLECDIADAVGLSVDVAHAIHPNIPEKSDPTNKLYMNRGFAMKTSASEKYASDPKVIGIVLQLCEKYNIKTQRYVNRSDIPGGSTLGSIATAHLPMRMLDVGVPILAMHSARETMGTDDQYYLEQIIEKFLNE